ncbi:MAG TPA: hypothetical protein VFB78_03730 [Acidimicrobiales bacterium]|nr:hypothetical protein [Acidimicrobiales bacterium]
MSTLGDRLLAIHDAFDTAGVGHAFGGAIALAYCTEEPRGTRDIDVNVFVPTEDARRALDALPPGVAFSDADLAAITRDDQVRLWWDDTPVDLFFQAHDFHRRVADGVRDVAFEGRRIPIIDCEALTLFKVLFNRTRDWADIEAMIDARAIDPDEAADAVGELLGADDPVVVRLRTLPRTNP